MCFRNRLHVIVALEALIVFSSEQAACAQFGPAQVAVSPIVEREVSVSQTVVGTVMPLQKAIVGSAVEGRVIVYPLNAGDRVEKDQVLAQLLTTTIELELKTARAELALRQQQHKELQNGTRPEEKAQAEARMLGAQATMVHRSKRRQRYEAMFASNQAVSPEERDAAVSEAIAAEQAYQEARQAYELARLGPRVEQIAQAQAQVDMQQATVERLTDRLEKHTIRAHFASYVTAEHTEVGSWLKAGDPVAEVAALDEIEITAHLVEQFVPYTRVGMTVAVEVPAVPKREFSGQVTAIVPQADVQARTFPVQIRVKNELVDGQPLLKAGMYARVLLPTGRREMARLVPKDALVLGGPQTMVFVVETAGDGKQGKARPVPVELGASTGSQIQVIGNLQPGQLVVVQGNERLPPMESEVNVQRVIPPPEPEPRRAAVTPTGAR
jgi:RND family efflux transporter MFP subunit